MAANKNTIKQLLHEFANSIQVKFSTNVKGQPEDQIRSPFEVLIKESGHCLNLKAIPIGETLLTNKQGKPDYGIAIDNLLCGYVELKAPGKGADTSTYLGHDKKQAEKFLNLPNILYSDGIEWTLYQGGVKSRSVIFDKKLCLLGSTAISDKNAVDFEALLLSFFNWNPITPTSAKQLALFLAPLCSMLRDDVIAALKSGEKNLKSAASDWRRYLFPDASDEQFADSYAQTVTFALLLARSNGSQTLFLDEAVEELTKSTKLLARSLKVLTDELLEQHLQSSLGMLKRVINAVPTGTMTGGKRDPWLHFYEDFLNEYDPNLRKDAGAYYTPVEVVQAQVKIIDDLLTKKFNKQIGFADGGVKVLDPAVGTGTYLLAIIEQALERVEEEDGKGAVRHAANGLSNSLFGFEIMVGPYAVAALRLTRMLQDAGANIPADGVQIMLNNTLESPYEKMADIPLFYEPIAIEHKRAKRVKESVPILVCIGNPPYDRHEAVNIGNHAKTGGWVRHGDNMSNDEPILNDFINPVKEAGKGGQLKNLYNLYVYFWRWALWKTFEHELASEAGIVSYITASSFLDGDAFIGMRQKTRELCDDVWIIDLGGEGRGTRKDDNVFAIQTPVCITVAVRYGKTDVTTPANIHYTKVEGAKASKLGRLQSIKSLDDFSFVKCSTDWQSSFKPEGVGEYFNWPLLTDIMPWQHSGSQIKRTWPIGVTKEVLEERWDILRKSAEKEILFKESRDRKITKSVRDLENPQLSQTPIISITVDELTPSIEHYGYRSFDRFFILKDNRLADFIRPDLWDINSQKQVYFSLLSTQSLSVGPALTLSPYVPDLHYYRGSFGAKDILPLYRDYDATHPNIHPDLLKKLSAAYKETIDADMFACYLYGIMANSDYTDRFHTELSSKELRVPITLNKKLFDDVAAIGKELIFLHSYGENFSDDFVWPKNTIKSIKPISTTDLPDRFFYDEIHSLITVGEGTFSPVPKEIWEFNVSGLKVVQSWLGYRVKNRKGKKTSPLDDIRPDSWTLDMTREFLKLLNLLSRTLEVYPLQKNLLDDVLKEEILQSDDLGGIPDVYRQKPKKIVTQGSLDL